MGIEYILYTKTFEKQYDKLPLRIQESIEEKEAIFRKDVFDFRLKSHKLHGREVPAWAFWINKSYRIKFILLPDRGALLIEVGTHEIYR